jgi:hypothetical protein
MKPSWTIISQLSTCWRPQTTGYSYPWVTAIQINIHSTVKNLIHMTHTLLTSVHVRHAYAFCGQSPYVATFHADPTELDGCTTLEKKCSQLHLSAWLSGPQDSTQFLSQYNHWSSAFKPNICWWTSYINLLGSYLQHVISKFNTCSRGQTHRSLTDTDGGYNLGGVGFPYHSPRPFHPMVLRFSSKSPTRS